MGISMKKGIIVRLVALCIVCSVFVTDTTVVLAKSIYSQFYANLKVDDITLYTKQETFFFSGDYWEYDL